MTTPRSTYRLQLHADFTFRDAARQVPYFADLGVTHLYLSPSLQAAPGSTHGYDVVDPTRLSEELGGAAGLLDLAAVAHEAGIGLILDIVPNHVGLLSPANPWWWDVLLHGPSSRYASYFDIDWERHGDGPPQVVVPHLGEPLDVEIADRTDLRVEYDRSWGVGEDAYRVVYHEHQWPLRHGSLQEAGLDPADRDALLKTLRADRGRLYGLLLHQHYRLTHWRRANEELNYRRFFDVTTLGALRVENPAVFEDSHRQVLDLVRAGHVDGLRIDHPDGLYDPAGYLRRLRSEAGPDTWIVIEKILEDGERRRDWDVDGTVGYEFANRVLHLHVDPRSTGVLTDLYARVLGERPDWEALVTEGKREVLTTLFVTERKRLLRLLVAAADEVVTTVSQDDLDAALVEVLVDFPVYRTYVEADAGIVTDDDRRIVEEAVARSRARRPDLSEALDVIGEILVLDATTEHTSEFVMRFQQLTGPVMAKGVEDTALYRYLRFPAANEVGGHPGSLGLDLGSFHQANLVRQREWPTTMLTTSTHDTKRSEDVRARLAVLSQRPDLWVNAVTELGELAAPHRGARGPNANLLYLALHTLVGAWPISAERLTAYLVKAAREEKRDTSWLQMDGAYEDDVAAFVDGLFGDAEFVAALERMVDEVREPGRLTSLSQTLLRLTSPGVPDTYQGCDLWDLSLVDPDNRRPVDLDHRHRLLADLDGPPRPDEILDRMDEGLPKLWVIRQALHARREHAEAFGAGATYDPIYAEGAHADQVVAFLRADRVLPVAPRLVAELGLGFADWSWGDTALELPGGRWRDELSGARWEGGKHALAELLATFPCALLVRDQ